MGGVMRAALSQAGVPTIRQGDVYLIPDQYIHFADTDLAARTMHPSRYVLVLQDDTHARNVQCPSVLVALMSSKTQNKGPWEYLLPEGAGGQPLESLVKVHLAQPVPREVLKQSNPVGSVPPVVMSDILTMLLVNLGLIAIP